VADHTLGVQSLACGLEITTIKDGCHNGRGHDFRVTHLALGIVTMMERLEAVVTQTVNRYNAVVHGFLQ
jgi:hypothetical protein